MAHVLPTNFVLATGCLLACGALVMLVLVASRRDARLLAFALISLVWAGLVQADVHASSISGVLGILEAARIVSGTLVMLALHRRVATSLGAGNSLIMRRLSVAGLLFAFASVSAALLAPAPGEIGLLNPAVGARMVLDIFGLLLVENVFLNSPFDARWHVVLPCVAFAGIFGYDIALLADAVLFRRFSKLLLDGQFIVIIIAVPLLAVATLRNRGGWGRPLTRPRHVSFHTATLLLAGAFLVGLAAIAEAFRDFGADWAHVAEISFVLAGVTGLAVASTTSSVRSPFRRLIVEPFTRRRYDYRREWIRCIDTLSGSKGYVSLALRAIRAAADIVDSPGGVLFLRDTGGVGFRWAGSWNLPATGSDLPSDGRLVRDLGDGEWILVATEDAPWLAELPTLWLAVPLIHRDTLIGLIGLDRPRSAFALDREVFDLLRVVSREIAGILAEQKATEGLIESRQMRAFGERFTFVAHDIKNISSQLGMVVANAEYHMDNPEFRRDMMRTVRASVQKIGAMLARLREPQLDHVGTCRPAERAEELSASRPGNIRVSMTGKPIAVFMAAESFDSVLTLLVDNAIEAGGTPVEVRVHHTEKQVIVEIVDRGAGMSPEFVADALFRPFKSSKTSGYGIGAYQAREMARAAGGDLQAISRAGEGTTMRVVLPAARALNVMPVGTYSSTPTTGLEVG